jgi:hypothetical protein
MDRSVLAANSARSGDSWTSLDQSSARAGPACSSAVAVNLRMPSSTVIAGLALRLWYQAGCLGDPRWRQRSR